MSNSKDLGLCNDKIVSVERTSGNGAPGTIDTYTITLRSGDNYNFKVTNGSAFDASPKGVYATLSELQSAFPTGNNNIYIVSSNGHWYYWNSSAWTDGGVYLGNGNVLSTGGSNAKYWFNEDNAVSKLNGNLNNIPENSICYCAFGESVAKQLTNFPDDAYNNHKLGSSHTIISYKSYYDATTYGVIQVLMCNGAGTYIRRWVSVNNSWTNWEVIASNYMPSYYVDSGCDLAQITDLNTITYNSYYRFNYEKLNELQNNPASILVGSYDKDTTFIIETKKMEYSNLVNGTVSFQFLKNDYETILGYRVHLGNTNYWTEWLRNDEDDLNLTMNEYHDVYSGNSVAFDLNTVKDNSTYVFSGKYLATKCTNYPSFIPNTDDTYLCITLKFEYGTYIVRQQYFLKSNTLEIVANRFYIPSGWLDWNEAKNTNRSKIEIGTGKQYQTLTDGMHKAFELGNCDVYIYDGTYDLIEENAYSRLPWGIPIGNNNRYFFSSGTKVICHYTGDNLSFKEDFSCFFSSNAYGDFEMYNCWIDASNIRYCVHDDNGNETIKTPYRHLFKNCHFEIDNTLNQIRDGVLYHCIGGGLGVYGDITIEGCYFNSKGAYHGESSINGDVSYHGNWATSSEIAQAGESHITVTNCYFAHNFVVSGPNTEIAKKFLLFTGNSYKSNDNIIDGIFYNSTSSDYWDIKAWNNSARN